MTLQTARHLLNRAEYDRKEAEIASQTDARATIGGFWEPIAGKWLAVKPVAASPEPGTLMEWLEVTE